MYTKAIYNLLRLQKSENPSLVKEPWMEADFRELSSEELFSFLSKAKVNLDQETFSQFASQVDTPEDLAELLFPDDAKNEEWDLFYLTVFELWRRFFPEKQSLSIFGDEFDYRIALYNENILKSDELIQDALANFLDILEENTDAGAGSQQVFQEISKYFATDIESFIIDYILDLFDEENFLYASELIEGYSPYFSSKMWVEFLQVRLLAETDPDKVNQKISYLLAQNVDAGLLWEIVRFLAFFGEHELFKFAVKKILPQISEKEEFSDLLALIADYYGGLDEDLKEKRVQKLIEENKQNSFDLASLKELESLLE